MTHPRMFAMTSALALVAAAPALADLTAEQVLADQLKQMNTYGMAVTTNGQASSGGTVTVESFSMSAEVPEGNVDITVGGASFVEQGDGTVRIEYPAEIPVVMNGSGPEGDFSVELTIAQTGLLALVSGSPDRIRYDVSGDQVSVQDLTLDIPEEAPGSFEFVMSMSGLEGMMELGDGDARDYTADVKIASIQADIEASDFEGADSGAFSLDMNAADLALTYSGVMVEQEFAGSMADNIEKGLRTNGTASYGPVSYEIDGSGPEGGLKVQLALTSGDLDFSIGEDGLDYGGTVGNDMSVTVAGDMIPFPLPLNFSMAAYEGRLKFPLVPSEEPQDFALNLGLKDLQVDDMLWAMIDAGGQLPRDPATLIIDLAGSASLLEDIFAPEYAETPPMAPPGTLHAIDVNEVRLNLAGAELTGDGAFTFNNAGPIPVPAGTANLMLKGGNTLLDTLVNMGLVPPEQAMGARMMVSMFARPGEGEDTLTSTIEMKEDGSILANGQRIK